MASDERQETVEAVLNDILSWADDLQRVSPSVPSPGAQALREFVDRIRTALKLERESVTKCNWFGNAAAMRSAMKNIAVYAVSARCHTEDVHALGYLVQIERWARSALSRPARNCDIHTDFNDAITTLADERNWHDGKWDSERYCILASWLLAPAEERKGDGDV